MITSTPGDYLVPRKDGAAQYACVQDITWVSDASLSISTLNNVNYLNKNNWQAPTEYELWYMYDELLDGDNGLKDTEPFINVNWSEVTPPFENQWPMLPGDPLKILDDVTCTDESVCHP